VGGVRLGVWGVVLVVCACVGVGGVVLCRCVCVLHEESDRSVKTVSRQVQLVGEGYVSAETL